MHRVRIRSGLRNGYAMARHQQTMSVHAIRRAGHQRDAVLAFDHTQPRGVRRQNHLDAVDLIAERLAHHLDVEEVARAHLVQSCEHRRLHQTAMAGEHRMRARAAHGKAGAVQMPSTRSEHRFGCAVVDRQFYRDLRDADRAHHTVAGVEQRLVFAVLLRQRILAGGVGPAGSVRERILRLAEHALFGCGETTVVGPSLGQRTFGSGTRPSCDPAFGQIRGPRGDLRRMPLQYIGKAGDRERGQHQHRDECVQHVQLPAEPLSAREFRGDVQRLGKRRLAPCLLFAHARSSNGWNGRPLGRNGLAMDAVPMRKSRTGKSIRKSIGKSTLPEAATASSSHVL